MGYVHSADGAYRVEVFGDPSLPGPVGMDPIHLYPTAANIPGMQAWYTKMFGGFPGQRKRVSGPGVIDVDYFHRFNISFSPAPAPASPEQPRRRYPVAAGPSITSAST